MWFSGAQSIFNQLDHGVPNLLLKMVAMDKICCVHVSILLRNVSDNSVFA